MQKTYQIENLCCANCAAKIERLIQKIPGVKSATLSFMTQKLYIEADESCFPEIMTETEKIITRIEPECKIR